MELNGWRILKNFKSQEQSQKVKRNGTMEVIMIEIDKVKSYKNNTRRNNDTVNKVAKYIETFGFKNQLLLIRIK